jgi:hypothetical protein
VERQQVSAAHDPGTPAARRRWLDSLPVGQRLVDAEGYTVEKRADGWHDDDTGSTVDEWGMDNWCRLPEPWPATLATKDVDTTAATVQPSTHGADPIAGAAPLLPDLQAAPSPRSLDNSGGDLSPGEVTP